MPPKKDAKQAPGKVAGKNDQQKSANDARRTFEHLGRVQAISSLTSSESDALHLLNQTADEAYQVQRYKQSADLLRAAEHLSFAALHFDATETVAADLKKVVKEEFDRLLEKSVEHAARHEAPKPLRALLTRMTKEAKAAMRRGSYRSALEFARGAEALAHVHDLGEKKKLPAPAEQKRLRA